MEPTFLGFLMMYVILDIAFILTSFLTLHIPAWRIAKQWARENMEIGEHPSKWYVFSHTIAYSIVAFLVFPALMFVLLINNKEALVGYSKTIIQGIQEDE